MIVWLPKTGFRMKQIALILLVILAACSAKDTPPLREVQLGEEIMADSFDAVGDWDTLDEDGAYLNVEDGVYRGILNWRGRYLWGVNGEVHTDAVLEVDMQFGADDRLTTGGIICRASPQNTGEGYYFLISVDGRFSIRRGIGNSADELVTWQEHEAIHTAGQMNRLRAVCVGDMLQFFVNGEYLTRIRDETHRRGYTGLAIGMPLNGVQAGNVTFDNLQVWEASMP
jgi:hypothetical protein